MLLGMQRVHISPGKALYRFCGERVAVTIAPSRIESGPITRLYKEGAT